MGRGRIRGLFYPPPHPAKVWSPDETAIHPSGMQTWDFDYDALDHVLRGEFKIKSPYQFIPESMMMLSTGCHMFQFGTHKVLVRFDCTAEAASRTIWHEITHVKQVERYRDRPYKFYAKYRKQMKNLGIEHLYNGGPNAILTPGEVAAYKRIPFEREAYEAAARHDELPLTKPRDVPLPGRGWPTVVSTSFSFEQAIQREMDKMLGGTFWEGRK